jgi:hypothetical protein
MSSRSGWNAAASSQAAWCRRAAPVSSGGPLSCTVRYAIRWTRRSSSADWNAAQLVIREAGAICAT